MASASYVLDMITKCQQQSEVQGKPLTVRDHLAMLGIRDRHEFRSLLAAISKRLKEDGTHHDLLGSVFLVAEHTSGRYAEGYGENPPTGGHTVVPVFESSRALAPINEAIEQNGYKLPSTAPVLKQMVVDLETAPRKVQEAARTGVMKLLDEITFREMEAKYAERENELLRGMARSGGSTPSAVALPRTTTR